VTATSWIDSVRALAERAPEWMRERASAELHIGGFTQAQLATPVLDVSDLDDVRAAQQAVVFFLVVSMAAEADVARVQCDRTAAPALTSAATTLAADAIDRIDDENVTLMRYFDVFLRRPSAITNDAGMRLVEALETATRV